MLVGILNFKEILQLRKKTLNKKKTVGDRKTIEYNTHIAHKQKYGQSTSAQQSDTPLHMKMYLR